ncbi:Glycosyltransferase involved in cell wall bisynthesis [Apibacter mensalis]|uniref:Glycosyltransferase involved in cell wall bisynthesis n=1 Tax=Apibacter mensalis TaxID=1586267 RepID=A0A0X3AMQ9_9FLAO|nr:glycosyltransferase family 2 protein [Apibacter mensalis]CVK16459.1 Glycosyltransferase involved in cell wall bisynthesis [Apibacter mensalis]
MIYKVSVIVPVYNVEPYLRKCLDSIINQTFKEIEIIIINDGSTDNSQLIIDEYALKYDNIRSVIQSNKGLSEARNTGIKHASGKFLAFVDSDDWIEREMIQEMYHLAIKHSAEIVVCSLQNIDNQDKILKKLPELHHLPEKIILSQDFSIFGEMSCFACNKIFKRELFNNISFPKNMHFEDVATIPRLFFKAKTVAKTNKFFYQYLIREGSITRNYTIKGIHMFDAIEMVKQDFLISTYKKNIKDWNKFTIFQGFYCFLAYYAYVKDSTSRKQMFSKLKEIVKSEDISKQQIFNYNRFGKNYLSTLSLKKIIFYVLQLIKL